MNMGSTFIVSLFVIGNVVGSGFFIMPSLLASLGSNLVYSWIVGCSMAIVFSLIFGRLYTIFPKISVLSDYFEHESVKKVIAIVYWISCVVSNTGILIVLVGSLNFNVNPNILGLIVMFLLTIINAFVHYHTVERIEALLTVLKFGILVALPIAFFVWKPDIFTMPQQFGSKSQIMMLGISSFWAFLGIETAALFGSGESARKGLLYGVLACSVLYIATSLFIVGSVPLEQIQNSSAPFVLLTRQFVGAGYEKYMSFLIAFTSFGALYGWVAATGKMSLLFAESKTFGKIFLSKTPSSNSSFGLWISSLGSILVFFAVSNLSIKDQFAFVADMCVYIVLFIYAMCSYVLFKNAKEVKYKLLSSIGMGIVALGFLFAWTMFAITFATLLIAYIFVMIANRKSKIN